MLYSEFIEGTGCRQNDHNYQVYKNLEIMYMNSDLSKQQIYEYGKKLVDNSKTPEEIVIEETVLAEIKNLKEELKQYRAEVKRYEEYHKTREDKNDRFWKDQLDFTRKLISRTRNAIKAREFMLNI